MLTEMMPVAGNWKAIGILLGISYGRLGTIQTDNPGNASACFLDMLACWLKQSYDVKQFGEPTWRAVVKVVAHPAGGDNCALALSIAGKYSGNLTMFHGFVWDIIVFLSSHNYSCNPVDFPPMVVQLCAFVSSADYEVLISHLIF